MSWLRWLCWLGLLGLLGSLARVAAFFLYALTASRSQSCLASFLLPLALASFPGIQAVALPPPALCEAVRPKRAPLVGAPSRVEGGGVLEIDDREDELSEEALMSFPLDEVVAAARAARTRTYGGVQR